MNDPAIISAVSPLVTGVLGGVLYWGWRKFVKRLDENRDVTLTAVASLDKKVDAMMQVQKEHQDVDTALFQNYGTRLATNEGKLDVLVQVIATQAMKEGPR